jgi:hypothetical protein
MEVTASDTEINRYTKSVTPEYLKNEQFTTLTGGSWNNFFYESHSWEYSLYVDTCEWI